MAAVKKLPAELQGALTSAGLDDSGLLAVYPRTHWSTLGLKPIGTRDPCRARSNLPISRRSTISLTVSSGTPPTLPFLTSSPPCFSPTSSFEASVVRSLVKSSSSVQSAGVGESSEATGTRGEPHGREAVLGEAGRGGETAEDGVLDWLVLQEWRVVRSCVMDRCLVWLKWVQSSLTDAVLRGYTQSERDGSSSCDRIQRDGSRSNASQRSGAVDELSELIGSHSKFHCHVTHITCTHHDNTANQRAYNQHNMR